jgi:hypothetical protein
MVKSLSPFRVVFPRLSLGFVLLWVMLALVPGGRSALAAPAGGSAWETRASDRALFHFSPDLQADSAVSPDAFVSSYGDAVDTAVEELTLVAGIEFTAPVDIWVTTSYQSSGTPVLAVFDPSDTSIGVAGDAIVTASEADGENALRNAVARRVAFDASGGQLAAGFVDGIALYAERPLTSSLSRYAALLQNANSGGSLYSWAELNRPQTGTAAINLAEAEKYAVTAYLLDHFGIPAYRAFLAASATTDWRTALQTAFDALANAIEQGWRDDLSRWTNNGWKTNIIAGFDLDPARALLARGNYAAAKAELERSQRLFTDLGDEARLQTVSTLITQCDTGLQAEALMGQTEDALTAFSYERANDLLSQAEEQYARMPPDQRPTAMIEQYRALTNQGLAAIAQLDSAKTRADSWTDFPQARDDAMEAGSAFAALGDSSRRAEAQTVLDKIDQRQRRLVFLLGGFALISLVWLLLWRRHGIATMMRWPSRELRRSSPAKEV